MTGLEVSVLGTLRVSRDGGEVDLGTRRQRALVAALALAHGAPVSSAVVIERVWGDAAPAGALATLHGYVAAVRRALEPDRPPRAPATVLLTRGAGYALQVPREGRDEVAFESSLAAARELLTVVPDHLRPRVRLQDREAVEGALDALDVALALWRGTPYAELGEDLAAVAHRTRLEDLRRMAEELRVVGRLALGHHDTVRSELESMTALHPLDERWWALRAVALAREARQAEALGVIGVLRERLADELGVDLSPPLQDLHTAILRQDPSVVDRPEVAAAQARPSGSVRRRHEPWAMFGRGAELAALEAVLDQALAGRPGFVVLTGEPGIGKSRLAAELAESARRRGCAVAVGQCSQDDGAPPLWPWTSVLEALGLPFSAPEPGREAGGLFRVRADVARAVRNATLDGPLLLVLEDLHWADVATLGVLRLLAESLSDERLLVVVTWRAGAESAPDLAATSAAMGRRHSVRHQLTGLSTDEVRSVVADVAGLDPEIRTAQALRDLTEGNPFYVVEFARLAAAGQGRDLEELLRDPVLPTAVSEVVRQRVAALPEVTITSLRTAAVVGRTFDLDTLEEVTRLQPDDLLRAVEHASAAGLLHEEGVGVFRFSHALVRDVLRASISATRLARTHALIAELLRVHQGREAEVAAHWRAAGRPHVGQAWRATAAAAEAATSVYAYPDAAGLVEEALVLQATDLRSGLEDRAALLQQAIEAYRWAAMLPELVATVERAVATAEQLGDVTRLAVAATQTSHRMLWRSAPFGSVNEVVVGALRRALEELPYGESELRCRVLMSLANELREAAPISERSRLCAEALSTARRLGDPALLCDVLLHTAISTWIPSTGEDRLALVEEAVVLARETSDDHALVMALTTRTVTLGELGRLTDMVLALTAARAEAAQLKVVYAELVLDEVELAWAAAGGRFEDCEAILAAIEGRLAIMSRTGGDEELSVERHVDTFALRIWQGRPLEALPNIEARIAAGYPMHALAAVALWRGGDRRGAARLLEAAGLPDALDRELAFSTPLWCQVAEASLYVPDVGLARRAYDQLLPYADRSSGPDGLVFGPVEAFLALAAEVLGEREVATRHAHRALELIEEWRLPPVRAWFEDLRASHGF